jgi:hypothetical protein
MKRRDIFIFVAKPGAAARGGGLPARMPHIWAGVFEEVEPAC